MSFGAQLSIDFDSARQQRDAGMALAQEHAERVEPGWTESAYRFLREFAETHSTFISEDVSDAAIAAGEDQPPTLRAWGSVYTKAAKAGLISVVGVGRSRRRHASVCPLWGSQILRKAA